LTPAPTSEQPDVTQLLLRMEHGDRHATDLLLPVVYRELRRLAAGYLQRERGGHTLQPTALVHEAYMRMVDQSRVQWQNRAHFFGVAAQMMRRVLVDHARSQGASKRGGDVEKTPLGEDLVASIERNSELVAIDDALTALEQFDPVKAKVVELRFFGGLSIEETAAATGVSVATVNRQWRMAKAWLFAQLQKDQEK
jgi:RNA polymerase sigma factor (TIGR02999 family)